LETMFEAVVKQSHARYMKRVKSSPHFVSYATRTLCRDIESHCGILSAGTAERRAQNSIDVIAVVFARIPPLILKTRRPV
jgi:hypothetical protein